MEVSVRWMWKVSERWVWKEESVRWVWKCEVGVEGSECEKWV